MFISDKAVDVDMSTVEAPHAANIGSVVISVLCTIISALIINDLIVIYGQLHQHLVPFLKSLAHI